MYLKKKDLVLPEISVIDTFSRILKRITFPFGHLLFSQNSNIDQLSITQNDGFPYAVGMLMYYFASDTPDLEPEFVRPYRAIIIADVVYTKLSPELFDHFALVKQATLERDELFEEDPRHVSMSFNVEFLIKDMFANQYDAKDLGE